MSFKAVEGQDRAVRLLKTALRAEKIHHAYLFSGLDGVGKKQTARELAKALNCSQPGPEGSCDQCDSCRKLEKGNHPDFLHLKPEGSQYIRIGQIRHLEDQINFPPYRGRFRISLIDKASNLKIEAANAFLKTLEEPPAGNVFILLVNDLGDILPTLVSRCLAIPFIPLSYSLITRKLKEQGLEEGEAQALSRLSGGSLGRALDFKEGGFWKKQEAWIQQLEGLDPRRLSSLLEGVKQWLGSREAMLEELEVGRVCLRDVLWFRLGWDQQVVHPAAWRERLAALAARHSETTWLKRLGLIDQAAEYLTVQANPQMTWEMLWIQMARAD